MHRFIGRAGSGLLLALVVACGGGSSDVADEPALDDDRDAVALDTDTAAPVAGARNTVEARIAAALAAGTLDREAALVHRMFALFDDARLPAALRPPVPDVADSDLGADDEVDGNAVLHDVRAAWDTLSADTRHLLAPYLARPTAADGAAREQAAARPTCAVSATWGSIAPATAKVRVWYAKSRAADLTQAQAVAAALDTRIWPRLVTTLGFKAPLSDLPLACDGGDSRLDIYIVASLGARGVTVPESASPYQSSTHILLRSGQTGSGLLYAITHQFMHAVQWSYLMVAPQASYGWMRNAMANWAVEAVYPRNAVLLADASCHLNSTFLPITDRSAGACASSTTRTRDYGAYLLYQYIGRTSGAAKVRELLAATTTIGTALGAINARVTGGLGPLWKRYAKALWNAPPVSGTGVTPTFRDWDGLVAVPQLAPDRPTPVNADRGILAEATTTLSSTVANVSTRFYRFTFTDTVSRSLMFRNTFYPLAAAGKKVSVQALWKRSDGIWVQEDWTSKEWIGLCRDAKAQRVAELVVVVASGEAGATTQGVAAVSPTFRRNNIGCWGFRGSVKRTDQRSSWSSGTVVLTGSASYDHRGATAGLSTGLQFNDASRLRVPLAAPMFRSVTWALAEAYIDSGCSHALNQSGSATSIVLGGTASGVLMVNNFAESLPASVRQQQYAVLGSARGAYTVEGHLLPLPLVGSVTGPQPDCGTSYQSAAGSFVLSNEAAGSGKVVRLDGHLAGTLTTGAGGDTSTWVWNLAPLREP